MPYSYTRNQKIAFLGGDRWFEGKYLRAVGGIHVVQFESVVGPLEYKVPPLHLMPLEVAREEGVKLEEPVDKAA